MKSQSTTTKLFAIFISIYSIFFGIASANEQLNLETPDQIEEGGIIPIFIKAKGFSEDPISEVILVIDGNPPNFKQALLVQFNSNQAQFVISTRIRISTLGKSILSVVTKHLSGKVATKNFNSGLVLKSVDFSNPETLNVIYSGGYKYPTNEIGQAQKSVSPDKDQTGNLIIRSRMHHPMLPATNGDSGFFIKTVEFLANGEQLATYHITPAISNDPYVSLSLPNYSSSNIIQVIWKDNKGYTYTAH